MVFIMMKNLLVFTVSLWSILHAQGYVIERRVVLKDDSWIDQPDRFTIPPSLCSGNGSAQCTAMGGTKMTDGACVCECDKKKSFEFYRSTFGFYESQWKCFENTKVRSQAGCKTILNSRQDTIHLMTLPMVKPEVGHYIPGLKVASRCTIAKGTFLDCDGIWKKINITLVQSRFTIIQEQFLYYSTSQPPTPTINGRIIRLDIECTQPTPIKQCVLFKVKGKQKCPVTMPTSPLSKIISSTGIPLTTEQVEQNYERSTNHDDNSGLIAGTLAGAIGLIILTAIVVIMCRRKKSNFAPNGTDRVVVEKVSYGLGVDHSLKFIVPGQRIPNEEECSYASTSSLPINKPDAKTDHNTGARTAGVPQGAVSDHVYGNIPSHVEAPIYNNLSNDQEYDTLAFKVGSNIPIDNPYEETENAKFAGDNNNKQSRQRDEPVYNVPEVPETEKGALEGQSEESPCYYAVWGPYPEGAQVYDIPQEHESKRTNRESQSYDDYTYNYVGDVITD